MITRLASTGQTQITGYNASNAVVFTQTLPIPPSGSAASDVPTQQAVLQADALLAVSLGWAQAETLPACSSSGPPCLAPNPGGAFVTTNSTTSSYVAEDTPVSQQVNQSSTTLKATLNGQTVFEQTYASAFSHPAVQAAVSAADAILTADHATPGAPVQTSSSTVLQSSQLSYVLTGDTAATGNTTITYVVTFGPAAIVVGDNQSDVFIVLTGQEDVNVNTNNEYFAARNDVTTDIYLTTQTYTIQGTGGVAYSSCDVNRDGITNVADVQDIINQALGLSPAAASDLNGDGVVNAVDIQFVINASLNLGCAAVSPGTSSRSFTEAVSRSMIVPGIGTLSTVAGNGSPGYSGDGGPATGAQIMNPARVAVDVAGNLYIADSHNHRIRKVAPDGTISTVAGNGDAGDLDPAGLAVDAAGDLYIADSGNHRIRKLSANGTISTVAGDGTAASLYYPSGVAVDAAGNLYIADTYNQRIRKVGADGTISTVAGNGIPAWSGDGGPAASASLYFPSGIAVDRNGNVYIADSGNNRIRKVAAKGTISTVAGNGTPGYSGDGEPATNAKMMNPVGVVVDAAGNFYIADSGNNRIRKVTANGTISTIAGNGIPGYSGDGRPATNASFYYPSSVALDASGNLFIADAYNQLILEMTGQGR